MNGSHESAQGPQNFFVTGLLSQIAESDQALARASEQAMRRFWLARMAIAEVAFAVAVVLLQAFPVVASRAEPTPPPPPSPTLTATSPAGATREAAGVLATPPRTATV